VNQPRPVPGWRRPDPAAPPQGQVAAPSHRTGGRRQPPRNRARGRTGAAGTRPARARQN